MRDEETLMRVDVKEVIRLAEEFECCPECGSTELIGGGHLCSNCKSRVGVADDAYWFAEYLKKRWLR